MLYTFIILLARNLQKSLICFKRKKHFCSCDAFVHTGVNKFVLMPSQLLQTPREQG